MFRMIASYYKENPRENATHAARKAGDGGLALARGYGKDVEPLSAVSLGEQVQSMDTKNHPFISRQEQSKVSPVLPIQRRASSKCARSNAKSAIEQFNEMSKRASEKRKEKLKTERGDGISLFQLSSIWSHTVKRCFQEHLGATTRKAMLILHSHLKRMAMSDTDWPCYIVWCIEDWKQTVAKYFPRMRYKPFYPDVLFLVKFSTQFQSGWAAQQWQDGLSQMTPEQRLVAIKVATGTDEEAARHEVKRRMVARQRAAERTIKERQVRIDRVTSTQRTTNPKPLVNGEGDFGRWVD